jgi:hypothetical protein
MRSQFQDEPSQGDYMLDACILFGGNGYVKIFIYGGAIHKTSSS